MNGSDCPAATTTEKSPETVTSREPGNRVKVLFLGWGRSGKDEAAQFAELHLGLRYGGSFSWHVKCHIAACLGIHPQTAWETRHANRQFWYEECNRLREKDPTLLARWALESGDIIAGLRDRVEFEAIVRARLFDHLVWVDRPGTPVDPTVMLTVDDVLREGGWYLLNSGTLEDYHTRLIHLFRDDFKIPVRMSGYAIGLLEKEESARGRVRLGLTESEAKRD